MSISGLVAEYIVAIDVNRVRFPADAKVNASRLSVLSVRQTNMALARACDVFTNVHLRTSRLWVSLRSRISGGAPSPV